MLYISKLFSNLMIININSKMRLINTGAFLLLLMFSQALNAQKSVKKYRFAQKQMVVASKAMVVTAHPAATQIGVEVLKKGGSAADVAVAVHFALAVCYPAAGNLAGGGFALTRQANGAHAMLDFRETAPAKASPTMFLNTDGSVIDKLSTHGALAAGTPGSVAGMWALHQKQGKLPWKDLLQPAIDLANNGFAITAQQAGEFNEVKPEFDKYSGPGHYLDKSKWQAGEVLRIPDLGKTIAAIRDNGPDGFYKGWVADSIVAQMVKSGGIISHADLAGYAVEWRKPLQGSYRGYEVATVAPPSAGGIALLQILKMIEPFDLQARGFNKAVTVNIMAEAEKLAYADRAGYIGDPAYIKIPTDTLLDATYLRNRFFSLLCCRANPAAAIKPGSFSWLEREETTHYSIVDAEGNAVAVTTTINSSYGGYLFVKGCGFILNNEMDDFSVKPGVLNTYGLPGSKANTIGPGKRMVSSMSPTILEKDGKLFMVVGTPGGSTIITSVLQTIVNVIDHKMDIQDAVDAPKFHHQWLPDILYVEKDAFKGSQPYLLKSLGYKVEKREPIGRVDAIVVKDGKLYGGADSRGDDEAGGVN